ncbi:MAG: GNAT family N-acetyltransferase [Nanoarchaeota archaeon]|nr:GNAT family N-acetyltransferase [Nanoarchaeota archaeon]
MMNKTRRARLSDWQAYLKLRNESDREYSKIIRAPIIAQNTKELKEDFEDVIQSKRKTIFVATLNKELIGYLFGSYSNSRMGKIDFLFVTQNFRKQGIATSLIKKFNAVLKSKQIKKVELEANIRNKEAITLYKKLGFGIISRRIKMEKKLR